MKPVKRGDVLAIERLEYTGDTRGGRRPTWRLARVTAITRTGIAKRVEVPYVTGH